MVISIGVEGMKLFRKHNTPEEIGGMIYEALRAGMASSGELAAEGLLRAIGKQKSDLHDQHIGEIMMGCMFGATLAIDRSTSRWMGRQIVIGMNREFLYHLEEQGATRNQAAEWEAIVEQRFQQFRDCLVEYEGFEPPWKLGRQFLWNLSGEEEYVALSIKSATYYLLQARDTAQAILNRHGPTVKVILAT